MTLRKFLLIPLAVSLLIFISFSGEVIHSLRILIDAVHITKGFIWMVAVAIFLQLFGHVIRAYKAKLIFGAVKASSTRFQFRALSIGYLFNAILPFRIGELVRARVVSGAMTISFGYALVLVLFERLIDALILSLLGLGIIVGIKHTGAMSSYIIALGCIASTGLLIYGLVAHQNKYLLRLWYRFTRLFNNRIKIALRFKGWTIIYGLQQTLRPAILIRYIQLSLLSWLLYLSSIWIIASLVIDQLKLSSHYLSAVAPYYGIAIPAGPASLGVFSKIVNDFTQTISMTQNTVLTYNLLSWAVLLIPISSIGLLLLFFKTKEALWYSRPHNASASSLLNKLYRAEDISGEMKVFLENYFSGNSLSRFVHDLEVKGEFTLIKYFKGGSDAITILVSQNGEQIVKKIIPHEFEDRLKAQYTWLKTYGGDHGIVKTLHEKRYRKFYSIDLEYDSKNEMFYEFIHKNTLDKSKKILDDVALVLARNVHGKLDRQRMYKEKRDAYIQKHIIECLEKAAAVEPELVRAAEPEKIIINGVEYDNLHQILERIRNNKQAWKDIATYRHSGAVHGDVIADNLLVSKETGNALIIDPAPDGNIFDGPVFDFGKLMQSLYCGYETLLRDEKAVYLIEGNKIDYADQKSGKYIQLSRYIQKEVAPKYLTANERRAMLFHAGTLYIRRLKHQVYYTPVNVLKFYAVGVKTLNEFLAQYEKPSSS